MDTEGGPSRSLGDEQPRPCESTRLMWVMQLGIKGRARPAPRTADSSCSTQVPVSPATLPPGICMVLVPSAVGISEEGNTSAQFCGMKGCY